MTESASLLSWDIDGGDTRPFSFYFLPAGSLPRLVFFA